MAKLNFHSVSIGYFPPAPAYQPLESFVKKCPTYKYQLYFGGNASTAELEKNVSTVILGAGDRDLLAQIDVSDREFLPILIPHECFLWPRWYTG